MSVWEGVEWSVWEGVEWSVWEGVECQYGGGGLNVSMGGG